MTDVKNGSKWFSVAMLTIGLLMGTLGVGGMTKYENGKLNDRITALEVDVAARLASIETHLVDINRSLARIEDK